MVTNAKSYNEDGSVVYADAERIRKMVSNFMSKNNPAYKDPNYVAVPTPLPGDDAVNTPQVAGTPKPDSREASDQPRKTTVTISLKNRKASIAAASPGAIDDAAEDTPAPAGDFAGKTFQQAQEQLISELIYRTVDDFQIFHPFVNLPPRSLTAYYQTIKKPVSLTALRKKTKGQHGREKPTGVSDFKTWDAMEDEVSWVWKNARTFNEDGSEISDLATQFEEYFKERLALAKQQVEGPQQPKITLKGRPKPVLHLGAKPSPAPSSTPGVTVDNDALARQKQAVHAGINGHGTPSQRPSLPPSRSASQVPAATPMKRTQSSHISPPPVAATVATVPATAVKPEKSVAPPPSVQSARVQSSAPEVRPPSQPATSMAPPAPRLPSGSPLPNGTHTSSHPAQVPLYLPGPTTFVDTFTRTKPVAEALMPNLTITTHPQVLDVPKPYRLDVPPSSRFTQQSLTVLLPASHYYLQIAPTISPQILSGRQYKIFVTVNGLRTMASTKQFSNGDINGIGTTKNVYDAVLMLGVNRIEVEVVAATGARGGGATTALETEKVSIFVDLMRR